jgi:hypothetical protein
LALSLLVPGIALAAYPAGAQPASEPLLVAQNLPPMQGYGTYGSNPTYNNTYNNNANTYQQPTYGQQQPYGQTQQYQPAYQQPPLQGYVMTAPPGTVVSATLSNTISSDFARVGDRFNATLGSAISSGNSVILPAGTQMEGQIVMVKPAGRAGKNGELEVRFTSAMMPNGQRVPLSARIQTEDNTGIIRGGTTAGRAGRAAVTTGVGAGLGAALGTAMGPLSGGGVGRGAIYGTVLGAGMGALGSAVQKGKPAVLDSGQPVNVVLDQPLTTSPSAMGGGGGYSPQQAPSQDSSFQYYQPTNAAPQNPQPYNYYGN